MCRTSVRARCPSGSALEREVDHHLRGRLLARFGWPIDPALETEPPAELSYRPAHQPRAGDRRPVVVEVAPVQAVRGDLCGGLERRAGAPCIEDMDEPACLAGPGHFVRLGREHAREEGVALEDDGE